MPRTTKKRESRAPRERDEALAAGTTAVASILSNIAQAIGRAELKSQAAELGRQRDHLLAVLDQLLAAYGEERICGEQLRSQLNAAHQQIEGLRRTRSSLRAQNLRLEQELAERNARGGSNG